MIKRFLSDAENKGLLDKHIKITSNIKQIRHIFQYRPDPFNT